MTASQLAKPRLLDADMLAQTGVQHHGMGLHRNHILDLRGVRGALEYACDTCGEEVP